MPSNALHVYAGRRVEKGVRWTVGVRWKGGVRIRCDRVGGIAQWGYDGRSAIEGTDYSSHRSPSHTWRYSLRSPPLLPGRYRLRSLQLPRLVLECGQLSGQRVLITAGWW